MFLYLFVTQRLSNTAFSVLVFLTVLLSINGCQRINSEATASSQKELEHVQAETKLPSKNATKVKSLKVGDRSTFNIFTANEQSESNDTLVIINAPKVAQIGLNQTQLIEEKLKLARNIPSPYELNRLGQIAHQQQWSLAHSLRIGPIPDYAPLAKVYAHQQLKELAPQTSNGLVDHLKELLETEDYDPGEQDEGEVYTEDTMLLWMRDYYPIFIRSLTGELTTVHYLAHNPNRTRYAIKQEDSLDEIAELISPENDEERKLIKRFTDEKIKLRIIDQSIQLPLLHENGNFIVAGPWVFVSEKILEDNRQLESVDHLIKGGYTPRGRSSIIKLLSKTLEVSPDHIIILPNLPHEATGHVDLYLMALNDQQVIIPKIVLPLDILASNPLEIKIATDVQQFLDKRASQLARLGLDVIRLPQLPPLYLPALNEPAGTFDVVFYSPTNGLLIKTETEQQIMLPHFEALSIRPELKVLSDAYESFWREAFETLGWKTIMVETTNLGRYLGLIHCVTAAMPKLPLKNEWLKLRHKQF